MAMQGMIEFANQADILAQIVFRLQSQIVELNESTCFLSDLPTPVIFPPSSDVFVTVSPGEGQYDQGMFAAAGEQQVCERGSFFVAIHRTQQADEISWSAIALLKVNAGLVSYWKPAILKALLKDSWEPSDRGGPLLRDALYPIAASRPEEIHQDDEEGSGIRWSRMQIQFGIVWDWNITGAVT